MNIDNMNKLIDKMKELDRSAPNMFNMSSYLSGEALYNYQERPETVYECRSPVCIMGWALCLAGYTVEQVMMFDESALAAQWLDIRYEEANAIAFPSGDIVYATIKPSDAVFLLENYVETGVVDWNKTVEHSDGRITKVFHGAPSIYDQVFGDMA